METPELLKVSTPHDYMGVHATFEQLRRHKNAPLLSHHATFARRSCMVASSFRAKGLHWGRPSALGFPVGAEE